MATIIKTDAGTYKAIARNSGDPWQVKLSRRKAMSSAQEHLLLICLRYCQNRCGMLLILDAIF
ncbi:MAG: hypothetical protein QNL05_05730 [Gammaproteobacteria bacterium]|nr:hypothetical protein [Gammaproteobacteria bacterium]MDX2487088.1 hypothetical protein [Gammaproteobacteria bacterium]